jgi:rsbT co-antagonist protein RsbR
VSDARDELEHELRALQHKLESSRRALADSHARAHALRTELKIYRGALEAIPDSINIRDADHEPVYANKVALHMMGLTRVGELNNAERGWRYTFEGEQALPKHFPTRRALKGEGVSRGIGMLVNVSSGQRRWLQSTAAPIIDEHERTIGVVNIVRDMTEEHLNKVALDQRSAQLRERETENALLIEQLETLVRQLSAPVIEVARGVLVVPLIGPIDEARGTDLIESTLSAVKRRTSRLVILELTGACIESPSSARQLARLPRALRILGARCVLAGIRPELARFLVEHDIVPTGVKTYRSLEHALNDTLTAAR